MDAVVEQYDALSEQGVSLRPDTRHMAAERSFELLNESYQAYAVGKMVGIEEKDVALLEARAEELPQFEEQAFALIKKFNDFSMDWVPIILWRCTTLYCGAWLQHGCPRKYNEDECDIWYEINDEEALPLYDEYRDKAVDRSNTLIDQAKKGRHTKWVDMAYETLNRLDPFAYPAVKDEMRGGSQAQDYPKVSPLSVDVEAESK